MKRARTIDELFDRIKEEGGLDGFPEEAKLIKAISAYINRYSGVDEGYVLATGLTRDHRTLQQSLWRHVIIPIIDLFAQQWEYKSENGERVFVDPRNEESCRLAYGIREAIKEGKCNDYAMFPPPLPFI
jgi:hypothetical protein